MRCERATLVLRVTAFTNPLASCMPPIPSPRESGFTAHDRGPAVLGSLRPCRRAGASRPPRRTGRAPRLPAAADARRSPTTTSWSSTISAAAASPKPTTASRSPGRRTSPTSTRSSVSWGSSRCRSSDIRGAGCWRCSSRSKPPRVARRTTPSRLVLIDPAPVTREFRERVRDGIRCDARPIPSVAKLRAELADSGLRERDPDAYRQRAFELSVAGYFADPSAAHDLTPFRVTGRVQQCVWEVSATSTYLPTGRSSRYHCRR